MGATQTVPIFSPDGALGDIPQAQLVAAVRAGAKPGVHIKSPDGKDGVIPADRLKDAVGAGATVIPFEDQPIQHPGFWATLGADLGGMVKGLVPNNPFTETHEQLVQQLHAEQAASQAVENSPERKAHGALYRDVAVPAAEAVGVNVPGMEQSAAAGDVAGVAAHAAAPVAALAATEGAVRAVPKIPAVIDAATEIAKPAVSKAASAIRMVDPDLVGIASPRAAHSLKVAQRAAKVAEKYLATPEAEAPAAAASAETLRERLANTASESPLDRARNQQLPAEQPNYPTERPSIERIMEGAPSKVTLADLQKQINDTLGGKPLRSDVSLREQLQSSAKAPVVKRAPLTNLAQQIADAAEPSAAPVRAPLGDLKSDIAEATNPLPEGFTPVKSSVVKGYKYDPAAQRLTTITKGNQSYTHAEVTPEEAQEFIDSDSKGKAWNKIQDNHVQVEKNGQPTKPVASRSAGPTDEAAAEAAAPKPKTKAKPRTLKDLSGKSSAPTVDEGDDLTSLLQQSLDRALKRRAGTK